MEDVHAVLLDILREVVSACDRHGIKVCMIGGGCLGLVRHGGFIPWDDDLDLAIWTGDVPAFLEAMKDLPGCFQVWAKPQEHNPTYQVVDMRTRIWGAGERDGVGIFIDIVPMMHWRSVTTKRLDNMISALVHLGPVPGERWERALAKWVLIRLGAPKIAAWMGPRFFYPVFARQDMECRNGASGIVSGAFGRRWAGKYPHHVVYPLGRRPFCGVPVFVPNGLHEFLVARYGRDYMIPHDEKQRWKHFNGASRVPQP